MRFLPFNPSGRCDTSGFSAGNAASTARFHKSFPQYSVTPLVRLKDFARENGIGEVFIKDESFRFGLNAFKVLGGGYAIGMILADKLGISRDEITYSALTSPQNRDRISAFSFTTATDGNHGRGVAWTASQLGCRAKVYMPFGTVKERLDNILLTGADAGIMDCNYDDCVRLAKKTADETGAILVQDTAFEGYLEIPGLICRGYTTMALECLEQLGGEKPTHIFLQAGVGSMACAVAAFFAEYYGEDRPKIIIVEPDNADCFFRTASANDGRLHFCDGMMETIMAGLACGEPSVSAWEILSHITDAFITMDDSYPAEAMRKLANPSGSDPVIISGESGAAGFAALLGIVTRSENREIRDCLGIDESSRVLLISTEGATDRKNYERIVNGR